VYDALLGAVESMEEAVRTAEGGEAYQALVQQVVSAMPKKELEMRWMLWDKEMKKLAKSTDTRIHTAHSRGEAIGFVNVMLAPFLSPTFDDTVLAYIEPDNGYEVSSLPRIFNYHATAHLSSPYAYAAMTTLDICGSWEMARSVARQVVDWYWKGFTHVAAECFGANAAIGESLRLQPESVAGISSVSAPMLGGTYFTPRAYYSIHTAVRDDWTHALDTSDLLSRVHPLVVDIVNSGDCKDRFFIGFPPGASGVDGCMVVRNVSTIADNSNDMADADSSDTAEIGDVHFDVILVQQTLGKFKVHQNWHVPPEFCHTDAIKAFRDLEKKACRGSTDNVRLNVLGVCYIYTSDEQLTISGASKYPVDKLRIDTKMFSQVLRALPSYNDPMASSLGSYAASHKPRSQPRCITE
jgi:hypothetical protein